MSGVWGILTEATWDSCRSRRRVDGHSSPRVGASWRRGFGEACGESSSGSHTASLAAHGRSACPVGSVPLLHPARAPGPAQKRSSEAAEGPGTRVQCSPHHDRVGSAGRSFNRPSSCLRGPASKDGRGRPARPCRRGVSVTRLPAATASMTESGGRDLCLPSSAAVRGRERPFLMGWGPLKSLLTKGEPPGTL